MTDTINEFCRMTAADAVSGLRSKETAPAELVEASIVRIELVDDEVNALPIRCFNQARELVPKLPTTSWTLPACWRLFRLTGQYCSPRLWSRYSPSTVRR